MTIEFSTRIRGSRKTKEGGLIDCQAVVNRYGEDDSNDFWHIRPLDSDGMICDYFKADTIENLAANLRAFAAELDKLASTPLKDLENG